MDDEKHKAIIEGLKPVCQCKGIKKKVFTALLEQGVDTVAELKRRSGAGTGSCQGTRCTPRLVELLEKQKSGKG